ncbi:MAG: prepilin peptidase [Deltaproteobacteria bacterium]|nr:prepilin peptidase [Deltaproteobacteria bacterium]
MSFEFFDFSTLPSSFQYIFIFCVGLCVGSFLNVVIVRLPRGRSIVSPSSRCGFCKTALKAWMNIPVFSFMASGGQCSHCGYAYSFRYTMVELLTAVLFLSIYSAYGWSVECLIFSLFAAALVVMSFIDLEFRIIPDTISLGGWAVALGLSLIQIPHYPIDFLPSLLGSLTGFVGFWGLSRLYYLVNLEEGLGGGDVKLMGFIGAVIGIQGVITTILVGSLLGSLVGILFMVFFKKTKRFPIPFGPFLAVGALVAVFQLDRIFWGQ